jgi:hypothetical protein
MEALLDGILMAIPQGQLSNPVVQGSHLTPEGRPWNPLVSYERGPIAIEDTSEGLLYQNWTMDYNLLTGDFIATPETEGAASIAHNVANVRNFTFTFDQAGRISIAYTDDVSTYLWWYDTAAAQTVTTDLGTTAIYPVIYLDDKRASQNSFNDMLLFYCRTEGGDPETWELFMSLQRERFINQYTLATGLERGKLTQVGMTDELRIQFVIATTLLSGLQPGLTKLDLLEDAAQIGSSDLTDFPTITSFNTLFSEAEDGPDFEEVVDVSAMEQIPFTNTGEDTRLHIVHSDDCTQAIVLVVNTITGFVWGGLTYNNAPMDPSAYLSLNLGVSDNVLLIASDTGNVRIKKEFEEPLPPPAPPPPPPPPSYINLPRQHWDNLSAGMSYNQVVLSNFTQRTYAQFTGQAIDANNFTEQDYRIGNGVALKFSTTDPDNSVTIVYVPSWFSKAAIVLTDANGVIVDWCFVFNTAVVENGSIQIPSDGAIYWLVMTSDTGIINVRKFDSS